MIEMSYGQQERIGFRYVLDRVEPVSAGGRDRLRRLRPFTPDRQAELEAELDDIAATLRCRPALERTYARLEHLLGQVKDVRAAIARCGGETLGEVELFEVKRYLLQLAEIGPLFAEIQAAAGYRTLSLADTAAALAVLDPEGEGRATFHLDDRRSPALYEVRREKRELEEVLRAGPPDAERDRLLARRAETVARERAEEERLRVLLSDRLRPHVPVLLDAAECLARLDLTLQKARLARQYGCARPALGGGTLVLAGMTNPRVAAALAERGGAFTPLTMTLERGATVITGANMGGKSVALDTVALNVLLVHCGFYPFARQAVCPLFDSLHLVAEDAASVERGVSSFGGEVLRVREAVAALDHGFALVLLDEFARGTNPEEGAAIARGLTRVLRDAGSIAVLSTHYSGVAACTSAHYQVVGLAREDMEALRRELAQLPEVERVARLARRMHYGLERVENSRALPREAVNICRVLGLPDRIIAEIEKDIDNLESRR